jgi:hypothetical protein
MTQSVNLIKQVRGINTYKKAIDTSFSELVSTAPPTTSAASSITVDQFFQYYDNLFYDIPIQGSGNSHAYLVTRSQQYIGAGVIDSEKQALIDEINSLRQQIIDLTQTYLQIGNAS